MFGIFCLAMGIFVLFFLKETKGRSLEDMDLLFGAVSEEERQNAVEQVMHKGTMTHEDEETGQKEEKEEPKTQHVN